MSCLSHILVVTMHGYLHVVQCGQYLTLKERENKKIKKNKKRKLRFRKDVRYDRLPEYWIYKVLSEVQDLLANTMQQSQ